MSVEIANYQEVIDSLHDPDILLIDVRDPSEVAEAGKIPTALNIPYLRLSRLGFVAKYQRNKPGIFHKIIFYCKYGELSTMAAEAAVEVGFRNVKNYKAGFSEWIYKWHEYQEWTDSDRFKQTESYKERM